jgi:uncharacterized protein (TIGR04255 family)
MPDPKRLEIDLAEPFRQLSHAPIVEAVINIRARAQVPWEESVIAQQLKPRLEDYPNILSRTQAQQQVTLGQGEPKAEMRNLGWYGLDCWAVDQKQIAQFSRDGFLFGRLQPYQDWERFSSEAMRLWHIHVEVAQPLEVQRVGVRFINRIEMQPGEDPCEALLRAQPESPAGLDVPLTGFFQRDTFGVPGHSFAINVIRTIQPPPTPEGGTSAAILYIDVVTTAPLRLGQTDELAQRLQQMRWLKNKVFFGNIAENALKRFK